MCPAGGNVRERSLDPYKALKPSLLRPACPVSASLSPLLSSVPSLHSLPKMLVSVVAVSSFALWAGVQAAPGIKVALSLPGASERAAAGRLPVVEAEVINTGDEELYINPYNTLLQKGAPTLDFLIDGSAADGEADEPTFNGVHVRSPSRPSSSRRSTDPFV